MRLCQPENVSRELLKYQLLQESHIYIEYLILTILFKLYIYYGEEPALYYWSTSSGSKVDLVIETQDQLIPVEIKQSETPRPEMAKEIVNFQKDFNWEIEILSSNRSSMKFCKTA